MTVFKNKNYKERDYEATNVILCVAETPPNDNWVVMPEQDLSNTQYLFTENNVPYYGYL